MESTDFGDWLMQNEGEVTHNTLTRIEFVDLSARAPLAVVALFYERGWGEQWKREETERR